MSCDQFMKRAYPVLNFKRIATENRGDRGAYWGYLQSGDSCPRYGSNDGSKQSEPEGHHHQTVQDLVMGIAHTWPAARTSTGPVLRVEHEGRVTSWTWETPGVALTHISTYIWPFWWKGGTEEKLKRVQMRFEIAVWTRLRFFHSPFLSGRHILRIKI